jgi:tetratricopeptide (TPR) repeat protein
MKTLLGWVGANILALAVAFGQPVEPRSMAAVQRASPVYGQIASGSYTSSSLNVQLTQIGGGIPERADVNPDGSFEFHRAAPGSYELVVTGPNGRVLDDEYVNISGPSQHLSIHLPESQKASHASQQTISYRQLLHKIPPDAEKALSNGRKAVSKGDAPQAREQFLKAIRIDPEFADAYNDLGALEASLGELPVAVAQFRKAIDLDPDHRLALPNLCMVLAKMQRYDEAGPVARNALRIDPSDAKIHLILALSVISRTGDSTDEALDHFQRAAPEIPIANVMAAELLVASGRRDEARKHLEEYLHTASPEDVHQPKVQALIEQLHEQ